MVAGMAMCRVYFWQVGVGWDLVRREGTRLLVGRLGPRCDRALGAGEK